MEVNSNSLFSSRLPPNLVGALFFVVLIVGTLLIGFAFLFKSAESPDLSGESSDTLMDSQVRAGVGVQVDVVEEGLVEAKDSAVEVGERIEAAVVLEGGAQEDETIERDIDYPAEQAAVLIAEARDHFGDISFHELLANIDDPRIQKIIELMPEEGKQFIRNQSLQASIEARVNQLNTSALNDDEVESLYKDIETLVESRVILPNEATFLLAHIESLVNKNKDF